MCESRIGVDQPAGHHEVLGDPVGVVLAEGLQFGAGDLVEVLRFDVVLDVRIVVARTGVAVVARRPSWSIAVAVGASGPAGTRASGCRRPARRGSVTGARRAEIAGPRGTRVAGTRRAGVAGTGRTAVAGARRTSVSCTRRTSVAVTARLVVAVTTRRLAVSVPAGLVLAIAARRLAVRIAARLVVPITTRLGVAIAATACSRRRGGASRRRRASGDRRHCCELRRGFGESFPCGDPVGRRPPAAPRPGGPAGFRGLPPRSDVFAHLDSSFTCY